MYSSAYIISYLIYSEEATASAAAAGASSLNKPGYVLLYAVKLGALISNRVTGLLRSRVKRFCGGKADVI